MPDAAAAPDGLKPMVYYLLHMPSNGNHASNVLLSYFGYTFLKRREEKKRENG
jgi:hypothetical protein